MRILLIFIFLIPFTLKSYSQNTDAVGVITDSTSHKKINRATITIYEKNKVTGSFLSDSLGVFKIPGTLFLSYTRLKISVMGYDEFVHHRAKVYKLINNSFDLGEFKLISKGINLKEVVIKKRKRYRDTLSIDLSKEKFERNVMINDLLSNDKGFRIGTNGKLYFKGKEVSEIVMNNGDFFGKNNLDIYKYLPALTLSGIEVIETDINELTNTTMLSPMVKVNLKLKEEFKKGKFGGLSLGYGTNDRSLLATDLYKYKNSEQISLVLNSNNINSGDNPYVEPAINFSPSGNDTKNKSSKITYRNLYLKDKLEFNAEVKGKVEDGKYNSETLRQEENINQFSKTNNSSSLKNSGIESARLNLDYRIDSLHNIAVRQAFKYNQMQQMDSLGYAIKAGNLNTISQVNRQRARIETGFSNDIRYRSMFSAKKGRLLDVFFTLDYKKFKVDEFNTVFSSKNKLNENFFIDGNRLAKEKKINTGVSFTEPLGEKGYLQTMLSYNSDRINYDAQLVSDSLAGYRNDPSAINNQYLKTGIKFQHTFDKISFESTIEGVVNFRELKTVLDIAHDRLFLLNFNADANYKITKKKILSGRYSRETNYPGINQLTTLNNSFDLVSQSDANIYLKPEIKDRVELVYEYKKSDSLTLSFGGGMTAYQSKFGVKIFNIPDSYQVTSIDNIGSARSFDLTFSAAKMIFGKSFNYRIGANFDNDPIILNNDRNINKGMQINQSLSTGLSILKIFSLAPSFSANYSRYNYGETKSKLFSLTYSDNISVKIPAGFIFNSYPIVNYFSNLDRAVTWGINAEIRHAILKKQGVIWIKAYDLFNSFSYTNNYLGPSYTQSVKYSNLSRYVILGLNLKFNNMK